MDDFTAPPQTLVRIRMRRWTAYWLAVLACLALDAPTVAVTADQHSVEAITLALQSPIPDEALIAAREFDDDLLRRGELDENKVYLITDERASRVTELVVKLLSAMGEDSSKWVVRVLDTEPKMSNAFVTGGKYVYVFTGLIDEVQSDDEMAMLLGHELGHSLLQHLTRKKKDWSSQLAAIAGIVAAASGGNTQLAAASMSKSFGSSYSQDDEREADAIGVAIVSRAGFQAVRGADFFTRAERDMQKSIADRDSALGQLRAEAVRQQTECANLKQRWNAGTIDRSQGNAAIVNQACGQAQQTAHTYNDALFQANMGDAQATLDDITRSHPKAQERVSAIVAVADVLNGVRSADSIGEYKQASRVLLAMSQVDSVLLRKPTASVDVLTSAPIARPAVQNEGAAISERMSQLKSLYDQKLITEAEYAQKKAALLAEL